MKDISDQLVDQHTSLVKRIAYHLIGRLPPNIQLEDLIQAGMIGLLEAARNYDQAKGASFETYAGIRIRGAMLDEVRRGDWTPRSVYRNARRITQAIRQIENETGRDAKDYEVAHILNISLEEYNNMLQDTVGIKIFGFDDIVMTEEGSIIDCHASPVEGLQKDDFKNLLAKEIAGLPEKEKLVLALYYEEELNLREIGEVLGVSESRISQIHSQAMFRLQVRMKVYN